MTVKATCKPKPKICKCVELVNKTLAEQGVELDTSLVMNFKTGGSYLAMKIPVRKFGSSRKKLPTVFCTFCPVCGKRLIGETTSQTTSRQTGT